MSFIELSIILLISLGILDKDKLMKAYKFLTQIDNQLKLLVINLLMKNGYGLRKSSE